MSFASGGRVTRHIREGAQGLDLEDTWLNFFHVSTNPTRGALEIHEHGEGWAAVRSSFSVIAIGVGARRDFAAAAMSASGVVSGWKVLAANLRVRKLQNLTSLPRVLMRLTELGPLGDDDNGDCYVRLALPGVSLLDFDKFDSLMAMGERDAKPALDEWLASRDAATE